VHYQKLLLIPHHSQARKRSLNWHKGRRESDQRKEGRDNCIKGSSQDKSTSYVRLKKEKEMRGPDGILGKGREGPGPISEYSISDMRVIAQEWTNNRNTGKNPAGRREKGGFPLDGGSPTHSRRRGKKSNTPQRIRRGEVLSRGPHKERRFRRKEGGSSGEFD